MGWRFGPGGVVAKTHCTASRASPERKAGKVAHQRSAPNCSPGHWPTAVSLSSETSPFLHTGTITMAIRALETGSHGRVDVADTSPPPLESSRGQTNRSSLLSPTRDAQASVRLLDPCTLLLHERPLQSSKGSRIPDSRIQTHALLSASCGGDSHSYSYATPDCGRDHLRFIDTVFWSRSHLVNID